MVEGARVTLSLHKLISTRSPSPDSVGSSLPEGAFRKVAPTEKHHQRNFLGGVRVFSAKNAEPFVTSFDLVYLKGLARLRSERWCGKTCHRQLF